MGGGSEGLSLVWYLVSAAASMMVAWLATGALIKYLRYYEILDYPNARSSHNRPTPRGGGLAVIATTLIAWFIIWSALDTPQIPLVALLTLGLVAISWFDDLRGLPIAIRLSVQAAAVFIGLSALPSEGLIFQGALPFVYDRGATALIWLWFINVYNFMDGIDGIAGVETATIGLGLFAVISAAGLDIDHALLGLCLAGSAIGFLIWNWPPAKIFLGDVGSIPLGFLTGWLLITLAANDLWMPALILPLYFLVDATSTLARRIVGGECIWLAHANHYYQRAARRVESHAQVTIAIAIANVVFVIAALVTVLAQHGIWLGAVLAGAACAGLLWYLRCITPRRTTVQSSDES